MDENKTAPTGTTNVEIGALKKPYAPGTFTYHTNVGGRNIPITPGVPSIPGREILSEAERARRMERQDLINQAKLAARAGMRFEEDATTGTVRIIYKDKPLEEKPTPIPEISPALETITKAPISPLRPIIKTESRILSREKNVEDSGKTTPEEPQNSSIAPSEKLQELHTEMYARNPEKYVSLFRDKKFLDKDPGEAIAKKIIAEHDANIAKPPIVLPSQVATTMVQEEQVVAAPTNTTPDPRVSIPSPSSPLPERLEPTLSSAAAPVETIRGEGQAREMRESSNTEKLKRVAALLQSRTTKNLGNDWWKYAIAVISASTLMAYMEYSKHKPDATLAESSRVSAPQTPAGTSLETAKPQSFEESLGTPEMKTFLHDFKTLPEEQLIAKYIPSTDQAYPGHVLSLDGYKTLNDAETEHLEGWTDQNGKDHRKEISDFIRNIETLGAMSVHAMKIYSDKTGTPFIWAQGLAPDNSHISPTVTIIDYIKKVKSNLMELEKRNIS